MPLESLNLYNKTCYELQLTKGADFRKARQHCQRLSGDLVHTLPDPAFSYLLDHLERSKASMRTQLIWVGIRKVPGKDMWRWVDGTCASRDAGAGSDRAMKLVCFTRARWLSVGVFCLTLVDVLNVMRKCPKKA